MTTDNIAPTHPNDAAASAPTSPRARQLRINNSLIDDASDCYVIAEIGNNHQGSMEKAIDLFHSAKMAGVNAVKMQKRDNKTLYTKAAYNKVYENIHSFGRTYGEHRDFLEFDKSQYLELKALARELEIDFFATAFDFPSADFLEEIDPPAYKIASGDLTNLPLIRYVATFKKPLIISVGGGTLDDVHRVLRDVMPINQQLCFLQCTATYPTEAEDLNLRVITTMREEFPEVVVGLSDHYNGIVAATVAYVLGARVIEKHFTLNHTWKGTDHALSLEPIGMHKMVRDLRRIRIALGDGIKRPVPAEIPAITKMSKSLYAARDIPPGAVLTIDDVSMKSPGGGIPPARISAVVGKRATQAFREDEMLSLDTLEDVSLNPASAATSA